MLILKDSQNGNNTIKTKRVKTENSRNNDEQKRQTRSLGAVCRFIDKETKLDLYTEKTFKPLALESIINNGAYKTIKPLLTEKENKQKYFSAYKLCQIANRLDSTNKERLRIERNKATTIQAIKNVKK